MTDHFGTALPRDKDALELFLRRMLADTGFYCRNVIGMDTDRDEDGNCTSQIGKGGVRPYGPHQEVVSFLDDFSVKRKVLMAPRFSYKSSIVKGLIERCLLAYPNFSILLMMHSGEMAAERVLSIRNEMRNNPLIREFFGDVKGPMWRDDRFVTALRTDEALLTPSLSCGSPENIPDGGRYNLIIFDDIVSRDNVRTAEGVERGVHVVKSCMYLRAKGAVVLDIGTPYAYGDAHDFLLGQPGWEKCVHLDIGYEVVEREDGTLDLEGEQRWPNLPREFLLENMTDYADFMSQYKLKIVSGRNQPFRREHFTGISWKRELENLTGYLLTDIATSTDKDACLSVLAYVGLDDNLRMYILDLQIGHWGMYEFVDRFHAMRARWSSKVNHQAELLEVSSAGQAYEASIRVKGKDLGVRVNLQMVPRHGGISEKSKDQRINGLQYRFQSREVFVCNDTVPRTWNDLNKVKTLWEPEGYIDGQTGEKMPDGELVRQFIRFGTTKDKDIPDCLALIDEIEKGTGRRYCFYRRPSHKSPPESIFRPTRAPQSSGGRPQMGYADRFYKRAAKRLGF